MRRICDWLLPLAATVATIVLVWGTTLPLGVPGEWEWSRHDQGHSLWLTFAALGISAGCYLGFVWLGARRLGSCGPWECGAWLLGLAVAGFGWLWQAQEAAPDGYQLSKAAWVLYFPGPSGYFTEARSDDRPLPEFLATYQQRMSQGDVLHIGTHPPGLIVVFRGLLALCRTSPALTRFLIVTQPDSLRSSLDELTRTTAAVREILTDADRAVLWLAMLGAQAIAAFTICPLFGLLRQQCSRQTSWVATAFWPAVPAVAVFLPKSDAMFPCITCLILWLWVSGFARQSWLRLFLAGAAFWCGLMLSLAFVPIALIALLHTLWTIWCRNAETNLRQDLRHLLAAILCTAAGIVIPVLVCWWSAGINLPAVWWLNFRNHAGFYDQFQRTYWKWLLVNPLELTLATGAPIVLITVCSIAYRMRPLLRSANAPVVAWVVTLGLLWLSGKNMGEAARLWIFLIPGLIWIAGPALGSPAPSADGSATFEFRRAAMLLALQLVTCAAIVMRVVGFHYS